MKTNKILHKQIMDAVDSQMKNNDPAETNLSYKRLRDQGYTDFESKQLIGQCVLFETFEIMKSNTTFDEQRYIKNLKQLPEEPSA